MAAILMMACLVGGPADGRVIPHPRLLLFRVPIQKPFDELSIQDSLQEAVNPEALLNYAIADYQFAGHATVNMNGDIGYIIYRYIGME